MTEIVQPTPENLKAAGEKLRNGELVAFATETVYGLGADATNEQAVARIFDAKERPSFNPLIVHVADLETAKGLVEFTPLAEKLAQAFWPGALTLVLPRKKDSGLSLLVSAGLDSVAVRMPAHPLAQDLLQAAQRPIAAPSANKSGEISPTLAQHVAQSLGDKVQMILDGGPCKLGLESTVINAIETPAGFLRAGSLAKEDIEEISGPLLIAGTDDNAPQSPGMLSSHYAPKMSMRLNASQKQAGESLLGFGADCVDCDMNLSPNGDLQEAAANLFAMMRTLDESGGQTMAVAPIPDHGLGLAINDRLKRAAAPRG